MKENENSALSTTKESKRNTGRELPAFKRGRGCLTVTEDDRRPILEDALMQDRAGVTKNTFFRKLDQPLFTLSRVKQHRS